MKEDMGLTSCLCLIFIYFNLCNVRVKGNGWIELYRQRQEDEKLT